MPRKKNNPTAFGTILNLIYDEGKHTKGDLLKHLNTLREKAGLEVLKDEAHPERPVNRAMIAAKNITLEEEIKVFKRLRLNKDKELVVEATMDGFDGDWIYKVIQLKLGEK